MRMSELSMLKDDLQEYANEVCNGDMIQAYRDDLKDIALQINKEVLPLLERSNDIIDLITVEVEGGNTELKEAITTELQELYNVLTKVKAFL